MRLSSYNVDITIKQRYNSYKKAPDFKIRRFFIVIGTAQKRSLILETSQQSTDAST